MTKSRKLKEAIKTGLAFAAVFGIALQFNWMSPSTAGWAVAVISLSSAGASIQKGLLRVLGTIPGCMAALAIHAVAAQDRWLFMLLACGWMFFTTYMMVRKEKDSYFWVMAGYVCLMILLSDVDSSANMFKSAVFRNVETIMGVVVYTLIAIFLWPQTNRGAIEKHSGELAENLIDIYRSCSNTLLEKREYDVNFQPLQNSALQKLAMFTQLLQAEGSENYEVKEVRHHWERFHELSQVLLEHMGKWHAGFVELSGIDLHPVIPDLQSFLDELDSRFAALPPVLAGEATAYAVTPVRIELDPVISKRLANFDRGAVEVLRNEMLQLDALTTALLDCAVELQGKSTTIKSNESKRDKIPGLWSKVTWFPVPDWDHLRSAAFVAVTTGAGYIVWIFLDPPGHTGWFQLTGTLALVIAGMPSIRASKMIAPVAVTSAFCLVIYVFIMPQLSSFLGLGLLLFTVMFLNCYFLSGGARFFCSMAILNMLPIQNQQLYSFAAMANVYIFLVMSFTLLFIMSYLLGSPRPEKVVLHMLNRFFCSAEYLMSRKTPEPNQLSFIDRWRFAFHWRQIHSLPTKLNTWCNAIDLHRFPGNQPDQTQALVISTQSLVYRLEQFLDTDIVHRAEPVSLRLHDDIKMWHMSIKNIFSKWSLSPEAEPVIPLRQRLDSGLEQLEERIESAVNQSDIEVGRQEGENFFRLLGGYRGVSEAALAYAEAAQRINWNHWREERF